MENDIQKQDKEGGNIAVNVMAKCQKGEKIIKVRTKLPVGFVIGRAMLVR